MLAGSAHLCAEATHLGELLDCVGVDSGLDMPSRSLRLARPVIGIIIRIGRLTRELTDTISADPDDLQPQVACHTKLVSLATILHAVRCYC